MGQEKSGPGCQHPSTVTSVDTQIPDVTSALMYILLCSPFCKLKAFPGQVSHRRQHALLQLTENIFLLPLWISWKHVTAKVFLSEQSMKPFLCYCLLNARCWGTLDLAGPLDFIWIFRHVHLSLKHHSPRLISALPSFNLFNCIILYNFFLSFFYLFCIFCGGLLLLGIIQVVWVKILCHK